MSILQAVGLALDYSQAQRSYRSACSGRLSEL